MSIELRSRSDCRVQITGGTLVFAGRGAPVPIATLPPIELRGRSVIHQWLPVRFDNDAAWDAERVTARLELTIATTEKTQTWAIPVEQR